MCMVKTFDLSNLKSFLFFQIGEFTKECSVKWNALTVAQKKRFNEKAATDKKRYDTEMSAYTGKPAKDETKPKRPQTAYFLFLADYRKKMKGSDMSNKELISSGRLTKKHFSFYVDFITCHENTRIL